MLYKYRRGFALSALLFITLTLCAPFGAVWADGYSPYYNPNPNAVQGTYNINPTVDPKQYQYKAPTESVQPKLPAPNPPAELKYKDPLSWDYFKYVGKNLIHGRLDYLDKNRRNLGEYSSDLVKYPTRSDLWKGVRKDRFDRMWGWRGFFWKNVLINGYGLFLPDHYDGLDQNGKPKYRSSPVKTGLDIYTGIVTVITTNKDVKRLNEIQEAANKATKVTEYASEGSKLIGGPAGKIFGKVNPALAAIGIGFSSVDLGINLYKGDWAGATVNGGDIAMGVAVILGAAAVTAPALAPIAIGLAVAGAVAWGVGTAVKNWGSIEAFCKNPKRGFSELYSDSKLKAGVDWVRGLFG